MTPQYTLSLESERTAIPPQASANQTSTDQATTYQHAIRSGNSTPTVISQQAPEPYQHRLLPEIGQIDVKHQEYHSPLVKEEENDSKVALEYEEVKVKEARPAKRNFDEAFSASVPEENSPKLEQDDRRMSSSPQNFPTEHPGYLPAKSIGISSYEQAEVLFDPRWEETESQEQSQEVGADEENFEDTEDMSGGSFERSILALFGDVDYTDLGLDRDEYVEFVYKQTYRNACKEEIENEVISDEEDDGIGESDEETDEAWTSESDGKTDEEWNE